MTEIEKKTEEYVKDFRMKHNFVIGDYCTYFDFRDAYKDGYEQGQKDLPLTSQLYHDNSLLKQENEELKAQIEIKTKENELIKLKMRNCLNCCYYKILKPIYESPIYDEDDLPYPCRDCENSNKWEFCE